MALLYFRIGREWAEFPTTPRVFPRDASGQHAVRVFFQARFRQPPFTAPLRRSHGPATSRWPPTFIPRTWY
jgi:hypothetical protein